MTIGSQIAWDDTVLPFQLDASGIRGRVARLDGVLDQVLKQHAYPPVIEALVAETALLTAMIGQTIKHKWKLSLQVRGKGPARRSGARPGASLPVQGVSTRQVVLPCASSLPAASTRRPSAVATRRPACSILPSARTRPVAVLMPRTRLILYSSVV